jgi:predicted RNase H-like HicB family nuclease
MKQKVTAIIEKGNGKFVSIYMDEGDENLTYSILGDGYSVEEAIEDFYEAYEEMKECYRDINAPFPEAEFTFKYDPECFGREELLPEHALVARQCAQALADQPAVQHAMAV